MENVQGLQDLNVTIGEFLSRIERPTRALTEVGVMLSSRIQDQFRLGGVPSWQPSLRVQKHGGQTLLLSGRLMKSVSIPEIEGTTISFGSNLPYARIHQFGGEIVQPARSETFVRPRSMSGQFRKLGGKRTPGKGFTFGERIIHMPERPYIVFTDQDKGDAGAIMVRYALGGA